MESAALARRKEKVLIALRELVGIADMDQCPRVGICLSGGGWRAMASSCAFLDGLSIPLQSADGNGTVTSAKPLDVVSHIAGLSGGSWALFVTLAGGATMNPFHQPPDRRIAPLPHPWAAGQHFNSKVHKYEGLVQMVSKSHIEACLHMRQSVVNAPAALLRAGTDTHFIAVLSSQRLGESFVERWSNFLANDVLHFLDPAKDDSDDEGVDATDEAAIRAADAQRRSRQVHVASLAPFVESGDFPFVVCAAIRNAPADKTDAPSTEKSDAPVAKAPRLYEWVEVTPFFARHCSSATETTDVDGIKAHFGKDADTGEAMPLRVHRWMGICGSAFACDAASVLPYDVVDKMRPHVTMKSDPLLGTGVSHVSLANGTPFGDLRDAGIDFNIPLPTLLATAGRQMDIIIVHDAGFPSGSAAELQRAIDLGYYRLASNSPSPKENFKKGERVRVYTGAEGYPTVIYFLGNSRWPTHRIVHSADDVLRSATEIRKNVRTQLIPALMTCLRLVASRKTIATVHPSLASLRDVAATDDVVADGDDDDDDDDASPDGVSLLLRTSNTARMMVLHGITNRAVTTAVEAFGLVENAARRSLPPPHGDSVMSECHRIAIDEADRGSVGVKPPPLPSALTGNSEIVRVMTELGLWCRADDRSLALHEAWKAFFAARAVANRLRNPKPTDPPPLSFGPSWTPVLWSLVCAILESENSMDAQTLKPVTVCVEQEFRRAMLSNNMDTIAQTDRKVSATVGDALRGVGPATAAVVLAPIASSIPMIPSNDRVTTTDFVLSIGERVAATGTDVGILKALLHPSSESVPGALLYVGSPLQRRRVYANLVDAAKQNTQPAVSKAMVAYLDSTFGESMTYSMAVEFALPQSLRELIVDHLDDVPSVTAILNNADWRVTALGRERMKRCITEVWHHGIASHEFRDWLVKECVYARRHYWEIFAPCVRHFAVPQGLDPFESAAAMKFVALSREAHQTTFDRAAEAVRSRLEKDVATAAAQAKKTLGKFMKW